MRIDHSGEENRRNASSELMKNRERASLGNGSDLLVTLSFDNDTQVIHAEVEGREKTGRPIQPYHLDELTSPSLSINISTAGLPGIDGDNGWDGFDGEPGAHGVDATMHAKGTDGSAGTDGEDGTPGTDGGPGMDAGDLTIRLKAEDLDLLSICAIDISGGAGGLPGEHGRGGTGGEGGKGGAPLEWTTIHRIEVPHTKWETRLIGDNFEQVEVHDSVTEYRHVVNYSAGGRDGKRGKNGRTPRRVLSSGHEGKNGSFNVEVMTDEGVVRYPGPYRLALKGFRLVPSISLTTWHQETLLANGDTVAIEDIEISNSGHIPTPAGQGFRISVRANEWCTPASNELFILDSIAPGESVIVPGKLFFTVKELDLVTNPHKHHSGVVDLTARAHRFGAEVQSFTQPQEFTIEEALETCVDVPGSLEPERVEQIKISAYSKKIKPQPGAESLLAREIRCRLKIRGSHEKNPALVFCNEKGSEIYGTSLDIRLCDKLRRTEVVTAYAKLLSPGFHGIYNLESDFFIERREESGDFRLFKSHRRQIKATFGYQRNPTDDILFWFERTTSIESVNSWTEVFKSLGLSCALTDDPYFPLDDWRGKMVMFSSDRRDNDYNDRSLVEHTVKYGTKLAGNVSGRWYRGFENIWGPKERVLVEGLSGLEALLRKEPLTPERQLVVLVKRAFPLWGTPEQSKHWLDVQVSRINSLLEKLYPLEGFNLEKKLGPEASSQNRFLKLKKESLGQVEISMVRMPRDRDTYWYKGWSKGEIQSTASKIIILASMPNQQLISHSLKVLFTPDSSPDLVDCCCKALIFRIWREAHIDYRCYFAHSLKDNSVLEVFSRELVVRLGEVDEIPLDRIAMFVGKVSLLARWYAEDPAPATSLVQKSLGWLREKWNFVTQPDNLLEVIRDRGKLRTRNLEEHLNHIEEGVAARVTRSQFASFKSQCAHESITVSIDREGIPFSLVGLPENSVSIGGLFLSS